MRAAVMHGPQDVRVEDVPEPAPGSGEVKIRVAANGICGSDLHLYFMPEMLGQVAPQPFILGHEFAGAVAEVGRDVTDLKAGDLISCGACPACRAGAYNVCSTVTFYGLGPGYGGGLADYAVVARKNVHRLPAGVSPRDGALAEPLAVAYHAVRRGAVGPGQTVAIFGAGPIGIGIYLNLVADGVERIIVVEPSPVRSQAIRTLGAGEVLDPSQTDVVTAIMEMTGCWLPCRRPCRFHRTSQYWPRRLDRTTACAEGPRCAWQPRRDRSRPSAGSGRVPYRQ